MTMAALTTRVVPHVVGSSVSVFKELLAAVISSCQLHGQPPLKGGPVLPGLDQYAWLKNSTLNEPSGHQPGKAPWLVRLRFPARPSVDLHYRLLLGKPLNDAAG